MITIVGAGSIGLSLGGRLARAGAEVVFLTRRADAAEAIRTRGVTVTDPSNDTHFVARVGATHSPDALPAAHRHGIVVSCVRATETEALASTLPRLLPDALFVCAQNDVDNEARLASHGARVAGLVYRQTCTLQDDAHVFALGPGRIVLGDHPTGFSSALEPLARAAEAAGYDVGRSPDIGRDKWLKLCVNLMSTPNALVRRNDHGSQAFVEVKAMLLEEAAAATRAAGIDVTPCDERDRSLPEEIAYQRASFEAGTSARPLPLYNAVWRALGDPSLGLEADRFHVRIIELGERYGIATPANQRSLDALLGARARRSGPESVTAVELLP